MPVKIPAALKPGLTGAALGAIATMVIGFSQGGWYTTKSAEELADQKSSLAVVDALVPVCVAQSKLDPESATKITAMTKMVTDYEKRDYVIKAGWATTSGSEDANRDVAAACAGVLVKAGQS
jgi:pimeloyl-ACP methyl ester carboxylesterase